MLYISRCIWPNLYGVVDTDDDSEAFVYSDDLDALCNIYRVEIEGVLVYQTPFSYRIVRIIPYQPKETRTVLQLKTSLVKGVDVCTRGDLITNISWNGYEMNTPAVIRLSDFGRKCSEYLLTGCVPSGEHRVTLVFDDLVSFHSSVFSLLPFDDYHVSFEQLGVIIDVSEMTNSEAVKTVYKLLYALTGSMREMDETIKDTPERKQAMYNWIYRAQPLPF